MKHKLVESLLKWITFLGWKDCSPSKEGARDWFARVDRYFRRSCGLFVVVASLPRRHTTTAFAMDYIEKERRN